MVSRTRGFDKVYFRTIGKAPPRASVSLELFRDEAADRDYLRQTLRVKDDADMLGEALHRAELFLIKQVTGRNSG